MIVLPLDEADREAVLNFLLPELVRNGALIADCTVLHDRARVFVAERGGDILGVMALVGDFVGLRSTSENTFRKLVGAFGGMLSGRTAWSIVAAEELAHIEAQAAIEWVEPTYAMLYDPIVEPAPPPLPETLARRLTVADLGLMRHFYQESGIVHWRPESLELGPAYGVIEEEVLVAAAGSYYVTDWLGEVGMVGVLPRYRRRGYATLVSYLVARDILARAKKVCLHVVRANLAAHQLYLKMGYRDVGEAFLLAWRL
jgi:ribosomal protein S18 acetylase RimI-like enzyme